MDSHVIALALAKAWRAHCAASREGVPGTVVTIPLYLLGTAGRPGRSFLAYDADEFAAFLGGVYDGEFSLGTREETGEAGVADISSEDERHDNPPLLELPPGIAEEALAEGFDRIASDIVWLHFGDHGAPACARIVITLTVNEVMSPVGEVQQRVTLRKISPGPALTLEEVREAARSQPPLPDRMARHEAKGKEE